MKQLLLFIYRYPTIAILSCIIRYVGRVSYPLVTRDVYKENVSTEEKKTC